MMLPCPGVTTSALAVPYEGVSHRPWTSVFDMRDVGIHF